MKRQMLKLVFAVGAVVLMSATAQAAVENGQAAPDFTLTDTQGKTHKLSDYAGKTVVLEWTNYDCPFVVKHYGSGNMQSLQQKYGGEGVVWLSINSSAPGKQGNYSTEEWASRIDKQGVKAAAVLLDPEGTVGRTYGAKTTPHMFVVDESGVVVYQGAIDDTPSFDADDIPESKNFVKAALDAIMAGMPVAEASSKPYGCSVKY